MYVHVWMNGWMNRIFSLETPEVATSDDTPVNHSVRSHLRIEVGSYDETIRRFLPGYEEMLTLAACTVSETEPGHVLDLGAGTGALSEAVLLRCSHCRVTLIDVDPEMLVQARERLAPYPLRTRFLRQSFHGALPDCDAAVASLALHHVPIMAKKRQLYMAISRSLRPGGVFVNADITLPAAPDARKDDYETWAAHLVASGIPEARAWKHFEEWSSEDFYFSAEEELSALEDAGFAAECLWRVTPSTVMKGVKPSAETA